MDDIFELATAKCDRCGETFTTRDGLFFCENDRNVCIALCGECSKSFRQWLNHGPRLGCVHVERTGDNRL